MTEVTFRDVEQLNVEFSKGTIPFSELTNKENMIDIGGVKYFNTISPEFDLNTIFQKNRKLFMVFAKGTDLANQTSHTRYTEDLDNRLVFSWVFRNGSFVPHSAFTVDKMLLRQTFVREQEETGKSIIGSSIDVTFQHPGFGTISGKVDTGADQTCLHASSISMQNGEVSFTRDRSYKMAMDSVTEVQTADRTEKRANIKTTVTVNEIGDQPITLIVNLNDRSSMPDELLIGKDLLEQMDCLIDPLVEFSSLDSETQYNILNRISDLMERDNDNK